MKKIWKWLDGNKTIIGLLAINILQLYGTAWFGGLSDIIMYAIIVLTGLSGYEHYKKGYFTTKKGG